jgi:type VI secretion system secreted protein VgrG
VSFTGTEALSRPFLFTVDLVSENSAVDASKLLGKAVTLHAERPDGELRHFHGLVRRFSSLGGSQYVSNYRAEIVPALWFLSLYNDCRTFENMTAVEVVEDVCKKSGCRGSSSAPPRHQSASTSPSTETTAVRLPAPRGAGDLLHL